MTSLPLIIDPARTVATLPDIIASQRVASRWLFLTLIGAMLTTTVALVGWHRADVRFANSARLTYVKLGLNGEWAIAEDMDQDVLYYQSTLRTVLMDFVTRRYSKRSGTILDDWGIAYAFMSPELQQQFSGADNARAAAEEHAKCGGCLQTLVRPVDLVHIDPLPSNPGPQATAPVRSLVYAERREGAAGAIPREGTREIYKVTWRMLPKTAIQSKPDLLRYNPIGVEVIDVEVSQEMPQ